MNIVNVIGWVGSIMLLVAYGGSSLKKIKVTSSIYFYLNLIGSLLLTIYGVALETWPPLTVNITWIVLTLVSKFKNEKIIST